MSALGSMLSSIYSEITYVSGLKTGKRRCIRAFGAVSELGSLSSGLGDLLRERLRVSAVADFHVGLCLRTVLEIIGSIDIDIRSR